MKKTLLILIFLIFDLLTSCYLFPQNSWVRKDSISGFNRSIGIINNNVGFYTGTRQRIHKTTNGGENWINLANADSAAYWKIFCLNNGHIFALSALNVLYKSTNLGDNWNSILVNSGGTSAYSIYMCDANTGYLTNYSSTPSPGAAYILKTSNGGLNWNIVYNINDGLSCFDIYCLNKDTVYVCGHSNILKTTNGGLSWVTTTIAQYSLGFLNSIKFLNSETGFAAGALFHTSGANYYPLVWKTTNGGNNWNEVVLPSAGIYGYYQNIRFYDINNGFVVGDSGSVFKTTNTGLNWYRLKKFSGPVYDIAFWNAENATIVLSNGSVYSTSNGGWDIPITPVPSLPANDTMNLTLTPAFKWRKIIYNAVDYSLQISLDSSFSTNIYSVNSVDTLFSLPSGILAPNNIYYWRVNSRNPLYSSPWSAAWRFNTFLPLPPQLIAPLTGDTAVLSQQLFDWNNVASATYYNIQILKDTLNFTVFVDSITTVSQLNIPSLKFSGKRIFFWRARAVNNSGFGPWSEIRMFGTAPDSPTLFLPQNNDTNVVYNTLFDWSDYPSSNAYRLQIAHDSLFTSLAYDISWLYYSELHIYMYMQPNAYYFWRVNSKFNDSLYSFWSETRRFRTSPTYTSVLKSTVIPAEYRLYDNFPNPFNPRSVIRFDLPQSDRVTLVVINPLGKIITKLIDDKLSAGSYEFVFDGKDLPSGLYFYRLISGKYSETKKMILIK